jgi:hypothetical protein
MIPAKAGALIKNKLPVPLVTDCFDRTQMVDIGNLKLSANWELVNLGDKPPFSEFNNYLPIVAKTDRSGETITVRFKGRAFGIFDIMGPDAGRVIMEVDGVVKDTLYRFDAYCTYRRMNYVFVDGLEDKKHKVVLRSLCEPFDKASILQKRNEVIRNPDEYRPNNLYIGKILVEGKAALMLMRHSKKCHHLDVVEYSTS